MCSYNSPAVANEEVSFNGLVKVKEAKLYTLPSHLPALFCAALSLETAAWTGSWADGLLTTAGSEDEVLRKKRRLRIMVVQASLYISSFPFLMIELKVKPARKLLINGE